MFLLVMCAMGAGCIDATEQIACHPDYGCLCLCWCVYENTLCTFLCYHSIIFLSPAIHPIFLILNAFSISIVTRIVCCYYYSSIFFSLALAISPIYLCLFNLMRYASFFILHLKAFFPPCRSFLSISIWECNASRNAREYRHLYTSRFFAHSIGVQHFGKLLDSGCLHAMRHTMYFQFSVLSLLHEKVNDEKKSLAPFFSYTTIINSSQLDGMLVWGCAWVANFDGEIYMELIVWDTKIDVTFLSPRRVWCGMHGATFCHWCECYTCLYPMIGRQWFAETY